MSIMATVGDLLEQIAEKDAMINSIKDKTKAYIAKLKDEHQESLQHQELILKQQCQVLQSMTTDYSIASSIHSNFVLVRTN